MLGCGLKTTILEIVFAPQHLIKWLAHAGIALPRCIVESGWARPEMSTSPAAVNHLKHFMRTIIHINCDGKDCNYPMRQDFSLEEDPIEMNKETCEHEIGKKAVPHNGFTHGCGPQLCLLCDKTLEQIIQEALASQKQEFLDLLDNYYPYALGCTGCREKTIEELDKLITEAKESLKASDN